MIFAGIEDLSGKTEVLVFPKLLQETPEIWQGDKIVLVEGKVSTKDNDVKILADKVEKFDPGKVDPELAKKMGEHMVTLDTQADEIVEIDLNEEPEAESLSNLARHNFEKNNLVFEHSGECIIILPKGTKKEKLVELKQILEKYPGEVPVRLAHKQNGDFEFRKTKTTIGVSAQLKRGIDKLLS